MTELEVDVNLGNIVPLTVLDTSVGGLLAAGRVRLAGWSLRATGAQSSAEVTASVLNPAAGAAIATLALPAGTYTLSWSVEVSGTTGATDVNNMRLQQAAVTLLGSQNGSAAATPYPQAPVTVTIPQGGANVSVNAIALATVGATYTATIVASPAGASAIAEITSGGSPVAEITIPLGQSQTVQFTGSPINLQSDITLNVLSGTMRGAVYATIL